MPLAASTRLGRYEIVDLLGAGGRGGVYRARDPDLGREVAVTLTRRNRAMAVACVVAAAGLVALLGAPRPAFAQGAGSASLRGVVTDTSGGVLPGATVALTNVRTRAVRTATTDAVGGHLFVALTPGDYRLGVEVRGFAPWQSTDVHLSPGDNLRIDAALAVASQTERVSVTAERPLVRADTGAREGTITAPQIQNLSIISRGAMELLKVLPGTVTPDQSTMETVGFNFGGANSLGDYSVNGTRGTNISPVLDGSKVLDFGSNGGVMLNINPDMVDEVKIQTGNYSAEYGSSAVQVTAVTKGGSSQLHGSVYDYVRDWQLNANDRSNNYAGVPQPKNSYQYPGFNLSGPLLIPGSSYNKNRDRLFFFVGYEYQHQIVDQGTTLGVVPTRAQRQGDFGELLANRGENLAQPTIVTIPAGYPGAGDPAPNNDLSPYMDPAGGVFLGLYPLPNHTDPNNRYNYAFNRPMPLNRWQLTSRLDWNASERTHANVRLALEREAFQDSRGLWGWNSTFELPSRIAGQNNAWSVSANVVSVLRPSLTNEIVVSASRLTLDYAWEDPSKVSRSALGLDSYRGVFSSDFAELPNGFASYGQNLGSLATWGGFPIYAHNDSVSFADTLTKATSTHATRLGVFVERGQKQQNFGTVTGLFMLGSTWMPGGTGNDYGDLLVGRPAMYSEATRVPGGEFRFWNYEGFIQDSWKVRRNLTLELGLRGANMPNNEELNGLGMLFDPSRYDSTQGPFIDADPAHPNGVLLASRGEIPKGMTKSPGLTLMPRLNFSWDMRGNGSLVLRGGAGLFHNRPQGNFQYFILNEPPNQYNVTLNWWDVPGGLTIGSLPTIDPWSRPGTSYVDSLDPASNHLPRTWNWSLAVAKRLPWEQTLEVAYVGSRADHLPSQVSYNYVPPGALTGTYGNSDLDNPLHRAALDGSVIAALRRFPAYNNSSWLHQYEARSTYNAVQVSLMRQAGRRVQYYLNYTFSKALGTTGTDWALIDPIDPGERSYGLLPSDRTHIFNASYNLLLPDPIGPKGQSVLRQILNGWQITGITRYASGAPFRVVFGGELATTPATLAWYGTDAHGSGDPTVNSGPMTPVFTGDPRLGNTKVGEKILDMNQVAIPALGKSGPFQQPYDFRLPSRWNFDLSLFKNFALGGSRRLQLRVGAFNLFNQAAPTLQDIDLNLQTECNVRVDGVPNGAGGTVDGVCDPTQGYHVSEYSKENFGKILTKRGHRVIELAVRFDF